MTRKITIFASVLIFLFNVVAVAEQNTAPFIRMDRDEPEAWKRELDNVRFIKGNLYSLQKTNAKYKIEDASPNEEGLADLCISGSAQFSLPQFF